MHEMTNHRHRLHPAGDIFDMLEARMIGFDRQRRLFEDLQRSLGTRNAFPPFNLREVGEDRYRLELALAGFTREDLEITVEDRRLVIEGAGREDAEGDKVLHRGIAARRFRQSFALADHVEVSGAELRDGILRIELTHVVPDEKKPRTITIG